MYVIRGSPDCNSSHIMMTLVDDPFIYVFFFPFLVSSSCPCLFTLPLPTDTSLDSQPESFTFSESLSFTPCPQQQTLLSQQFISVPSTDAIDVEKLARQDQPPPAYENVDERPSSLASRTSRPLPRPPIDRLSSSSSTHSIGLVTDTGPHQTTNPTSQSSSTAPICTDPMVSTSHTLAGTSQPPAVSVGMLHPLDPSSQDQ